VKTRLLSPNKRIMIFLLEIAVKIFGYNPSRRAAK